MEAWQQEKLIRGLFDNYPEASSGMALVCTKWKYSNFEFEFFDEETEKKHKVNLPMVMEAFPRFVEYILQGKVKVFDRADIYNEMVWDAYSVDALLQFTLFGEVIYG